MSAGDVSEAAASDRATPLRVLGVLLGLLVVAGAAFALLRPRGAVLDADEALAELFSDVDGNPAASGARRLPGGETLVTLRIADDADLTEFRFVRYPRQRAEAVLADQFNSLRFDSAGFGGGGGFGGGRGGGGKGFGDAAKKPKVQDIGTLRWHGYEARYARLRHGGGAAAPKGDGAETPPAAPYDTIRVNLTTADQCLIAYARFREGATGSVDAVRDLLDTFYPREGADTAAGAR